MIERRLIRAAGAVGAAIWLARIVFSQTERRKLHLTMQALDDSMRRPDDEPPT